MVTVSTFGKMYFYAHIFHGKLTKNHPLFQTIMTAYNQSIKLHKNINIL